MYEPEGMRTSARIYLGLIVFSLLGTLLTAITGLNPGWIKPLAGVLTLGMGVFVLLEPIVAEFRWSKTLQVVLPILGVGAASEICGIYTGYPFGRYEYSQAWWPTITLPDAKFFPLSLPFAWLMMATAGYLLVAQRLSGALAILAGALIVTLVDLPMEWVMVQHLGYWRWTDPNWPIGSIGGGVPLLNSVGWLITGLVAGTMLHRAEFFRVQGERAARVVLLGHLALVLGIGLINSVVPK